MIHVFIYEFYKTTQKIIIKIKLKPPLQWFTRADRFRGGRRVGPRGNMLGRDATLLCLPPPPPLFPSSGGGKTAAGGKRFSGKLIFSA